MTNVVMFVAQIIEPEPGRWSWIRSALLLEIGKSARMGIFFLSGMQEKLDTETLRDLCARFRDWPQAQVTADGSTATIAVSLRDVTREDIQLMKKLLEELVGEELVEICAPHKQFEVLSGEISDFFDAPRPPAIPPAMAARL